MIREVLTWENLVNAWNDVRTRHGAPGIDGVSVERWVAIGRSDW